MTVSHKDMANAIRALSMDAVEKAKSGHPGMPMGMADVATVLFTKVMKYDPADSHWADRDRFILSAGHGSMLIYSLLYLTGYERPTLDDIKNFRQLHSPCAGHPEYGELPGVEMTTGPLGQGLATSVGFALAERHLNAKYGDDLVSHYTYVIAGDGCLMEGVSQEAISLAGHLGLGRLIVLWDDNEISIDGPISLSSSEDMNKRFEAAGWHVQSVDGHDPEAVEAAIRAAQNDPRPSLIGCKTVIGYGSPNKQGTAATHGAPLGAEEIEATRAAIGWPHAPFEIPADVLNAWREAGKRGAADRAAWAERFKAAPADVQAEFERRMRGELPGNFREAIKTYIDGLIANPQKVATRKASEMALEAINAALDETIGGSADLTGSNNTKTKSQAILNKDNYGGRYIHYGIREFGMAAAMNGLALHGGVIPYGGTFLVFTDYCRPAIRLSAIQHQRVVYVMTHDSIGLGEDGPTHQPIEHLASFRAMPNVKVFRPADVVETAECWQLALENVHGPSILALTRQNVPQLRLEASENRSARGAYRLRDAANARVTLIATGSEVHIALEAADLLAEKGVEAEVVSMPSCELFDAQPEDYRRDILKPGTLKVAIEAASPFGWQKYVGENGLVLGIDRFGASAPAGDLYDFFGLTPNKIAEAVAAAL